MTVDAHADCRQGNCIDLLLAT